MRALSHLLHCYDAYAIVATHSPLVLQEVPARAIRVFTRHDDHVGVRDFASAHIEESFGAPLDQLVRQGFGVARADRNFVQARSRAKNYGANHWAAAFYRAAANSSEVTDFLICRGRVS